VTIAVAAPRAVMNIARETRLMIGHSDQMQSELTLRPSPVCRGAGNIVNHARNELVTSKCGVFSLRQNPRPAPLAHPGSAAEETVIVSAQSRVILLGYDSRIDRHARWGEREHQSEYELFHAGRHSTQTLCTPLRDEVAFTP